LGLTRHGHGNHGALALPAAQLMGKSLSAPLGLGNTCLLQKLHHLSL
jgi:hypothetical protein